MINAKLCREISKFGRKIVASGLTSSRFGNISVLRGDKICITCTGSMLDELDRSQLVEVGLFEPCADDAIASTETCVHRAIYSVRSAKAVIHTHSPYAVALSMIEDDSIKPIDSEGLHLLGSMPVVDAGFGTEELAVKVSSALRSHNACIARGHGVFAAGRDLEDAYTTACMAEHSSQISYLVSNSKGFLAGRRPRKI